MAASVLRPSLRTAFAVTGATTVAYSAYRFSNRSVYAETPAPPKASSPTKVAWSGFTELPLQSSEQISPNVKKLTFSLPSENHVHGMSPVSSLLSIHTPEGSWLPVFRPYTPISTATEPGTITFLIKKYPNGKASGKMHSLQPGDTMKFKPIPEFSYKPNEFDSVLLIAGGSGITPIWQLTNTILNDENDKTKIKLVYANNNENDILLRNEIEALEKKYPERFGKVFVVSKPVTNESGIEQGYVTKEIIGKVWQKGGETQKVLVSGPPAMTETIAGEKGMGGWSQGSLGGILKELGYGAADVHKF